MLASQRHVGADLGGDESHMVGPSRSYRGPPQGFFAPTQRQLVWAWPSCWKLPRRANFRNCDSAVPSTIEGVGA